MKKIVICLGLLLAGMGAQGQVVNNAGSLAADSIAIPFKLCDSGCYKSVMLTNSDSIFIWVFRPGGTAAVWKDSVIASNTRIVKDSINNTRGAYAFRVAVADIDGAGADAVFTYKINCRDVSLGLDNEQTGFFQIYQNSDFNVWATRLQDSIQGIIDSLQLQDEQFVLLRDSLQGTIDSLQLLDEKYVILRDTSFAIIDSLQRFTKVTTDSLQGALDSLQLLDEKYVILRDSIFASLDTLQNQDNWILAKGDSALYKDVKTLQSLALESIANRVFIRKLGTVTSGAGIDKIRSTAFTEADNYWNNNQIFFLNGTAQYQVARVNDFDAVLDSFVLDPPLSVAPTVGDSFVVFASLSEAGAAGATDWSVTEKENIRYALGVTGTKTDGTGGAIQLIRDSVNAYDNPDGEWDKLRDTSSAILAEVINLNGSSLTNLDAAVSSRLAPTTAGRTLQTTTTGRAYINIDSSDGDISAAQIEPAAITSSEAPNLDATITSRMATYAQPVGFLTATFPTGTIANTTNITAGTITTATNVTTVNGLATDVITGLSIATTASEEIANRVIARKLGTVTAGASTTSFRSTAFTEANDYWNNNQVFFLNGTAVNQVARINDFDATLDSFILDPALSIAPAVGDSLVVFSILSEVSAGGAGGNPTGGYIDSVRAGVGAAVFNYFATDTSGVDVSIEGATVRAYNKAGTIVGRGLTKGTGKVRLNFNPNDTIVFQVYGPLGYIWTPDDTVFGIVNNASDTNKGYDYVATAPTAGKSATVTCWVLDNDQLPQAGIKVEAFLRQSNLIDSAGNAVINMIKTDTTDVTGKVEFTCVWSSYLIPATDWVFKFYITGALPVIKQETIPRVTTYTVDFR